MFCLSMFGHGPQSRVAIVCSAFITIVIAVTVYRILSCQCLTNFHLTVTHFFKDPNGEESVRE